ncbi:MAG TPA: class I SAM-dependent rRNA methyltransferase [Spirochaetia bacterium]|nr:class I SAM-dependent rRNA methyltransferase [Spirochaetia bacterium]
MKGRAEGRALILKPGKDKPVRGGHHWIFSGAVKTFPDCADGEMAPVLGSGGEHLGYAAINRRCSIVGRMVSFDETPPLEAVRRSLEAAVSIRERLVAPRTSGYRLVNSEADRLPGLIVDRYADVLVLQAHTLGMERLKSFIVELLRELLAPRSIYERSVSASRREEGLGPAEGFLYGEEVSDVRIFEDDRLYTVAITDSQKTGFFLDQRSMRELVASLARGLNVLDCFCYTGGFTVAALKGGASHVDAVDSSERALALAGSNVSLNGFPPAAVSLHRADVFAFLKVSPLDYGLLILDPPAFAKKKSDVPPATRGYREINRLAIQKAPPGSLLLTCSCSYFIDPDLFQKIIFQAARETGRRVAVLQRHRMAFDHPINIYHPETDYLKGLLLSID